MQRAFTKHGKDSFMMEILELVENRSDLTKAEQRWMEILKPCYNVSPAANSVAGVKWSEEARAAKSLWAKKRCQTEEGMNHVRRIRSGRPSPWKGRSPTEETREKMRLAKVGKPGNRKGKPVSIETREKMRLAKLGKPGNNQTRTRSPEIRAKISATKKGKPSPKKGIPSGRKGIPITAEHKAKISAGRKAKSLAKAQR